MVILPTSPADSSRHNVGALGHYNSPNWSEAAMLIAAALRSQRNHATDQHVK
jgi:hypothetical protein